MNSFRKLTLREHPQDSKKSQDSLYWSLLKSPVIVKEFASVTCTHYSRTEPFDFAIASSTRVQIYSHATHQVKKTLSRFKDAALSCNIREDGKLLVAGDASGLVQLFDLSSRAVLSTMTGHKGPVRSTGFMSDKKIFSASDDNTVKVWDLHTDTPVNDFQHHTDYVRACVHSRESPFLLLAGSYDHKLSLCDTRMNETTLQIDHGAPVESVLFLKGGAIVVSSGGNKVKLWDILSGGRLVQTLSQHQKTVTSLALDGTESFLFSGSLDHQVKITSLVDYKVVHSIKYPAPILSIDVAKDNSQLAVGMAGGLLSVRKRVVKTEDIVNEPVLRRGTHKHFERHASTPSTDDIIIESEKRTRLSKYEKLLQKFQYSQALDQVLQKPWNPLVICSMFDELFYRDAMSSALSNRDQDSLEPLLDFLLRYINDPKYSKVIINVFNIILDLYAQVFGKSQLVSERLEKARYRVQEEVRVQRSVLEVLGMLDTLFTISEK